MNKKSSAVSKPRPGIHEKASRKRDNIVRNVGRHKDDSPSEAGPLGYEEAKQQLEQYLDKQNKKHTPERFFILKKLYECQAPIDIHSLHKLVCEEEGNVALTTIYNSLSLFLEVNLVRKLDLVGGKMAFFEKTIGMKPHGYVICDECGAISLIRQTDHLIQKLPNDFKVNDVIFHVHGICHKCQAKELKRQQKLKRAKTNSTKNTNTTT